MSGLTDALILLAIGMVLARVVRFERVLRRAGHGPAASTDAPPPARKPPRSLTHLDHRQSADRSQLTIPS